MLTYSQTSFQWGRHVEGCWVFVGIERLEPTSDNKLMQEKVSLAKKNSFEAQQPCRRGDVCSHYRGPNSKYSPSVNQETYRSRINHHF